MASSSGAYDAEAGFNQSGGGLYIVFGALTVATNVYKDSVVSGSGGSFLAAIPLVYGSTEVNGSATIAVGTVLKDMGKTVVVPVTVAGAANVGAMVGMRTFRKFQIVGNTAAAEAAFGVGTSTTANPWGTFFLEMARESQDGAGTRPQIARYF